MARNGHWLPAMRPRPPGKSVRRYRSKIHGALRSSRLLATRVLRRGRRFYELVDKHPGPLFSKAGFYQRLMALSMRDERLKAQLFRFVDVLPSLRRSSEIVEHLDEYFSDDGFGPLVGVGVRLAR